MSNNVNKISKLIFQSLKNKNTAALSSWASELSYELEKRTKFDQEIELRRRKYELTKKIDEKYIPNFDLIILEEIEETLKPYLERNPINQKETNPQIFAIFNQLHQEAEYIQELISLISGKSDRESYKIIESFLKDEKEKNREIWKRINSLYNSPFNYEPDNMILDSIVQTRTDALERLHFNLLSVFSNFNPKERKEYLNDKEPILLCLPDEDTDECKKSASKIYVPSLNSILLKELKLEKLGLESMTDELKSLVSKHSDDSSETIRYFEQIPLINNLSKIMQDKMRCRHIDVILDNFIFSYPEKKENLYLEPNETLKIKALYKLFKNQGFIDAETDLITFQGVFMKDSFIKPIRLGQSVTNKDVNKVIHEILFRRERDYESKKWKITCDCFIKYDYSNLNQKSISTPNDESSLSENIKTLIDEIEELMK
jgi:hypothetical protein